MSFAPKRNRCIAAALALALALGLAGPSAAEAHAVAAFPIDAPEGEASLVVEVDPGMLQGEAHRGWVEARGREVLERRPRALEPSDRIVVELAGTTRDYRITVRVQRRGQPLAEPPEPLVCKGSSDELLTAVETAIDDAIDRLIEARKAEEQAERERKAEEQAERAREAAAAAEEARRRELAAKPYRPAPLGLAGAVATGLGGAVVVSGAIVAGRGTVESGNDFIEGTDYRPTGYALLAAGSVVLATGITLLVVDVVRCKKDRAKCGERGPLLRRMAQGSRGAVLRW